MAEFLLLLLFMMKKKMIFWGYTNRINDQHLVIFIQIFCRMNGKCLDFGNRKFSLSLSFFKLNFLISLCCDFFGRKIEHILTHFNIYIPLTIVFAIYATLLANFIFQLLFSLMSFDTSNLCALSPFTLSFLNISSPYTVLFTFKDRVFHFFPLILYGTFFFVPSRCAPMNPISFITHITLEFEFFLWKISYYACRDCGRHTKLFSDTICVIWMEIKFWIFQSLSPYSNHSTSIHFHTSQQIACSTSHT